MNYPQLLRILLLCLTLPASIFAMEPESDALWQQLTEIYENKSDAIAQLFSEAYEADKTAFEDALCEWQALPIAYEILKLEQKNNIILDDIIDFSLNNFGQFLAIQEYTESPIKKIYETYY